MAGLSNVFGGNDSSSSNDSGLGTNSVTDVTNAIGLDVNNSNSQESTDEDGNSQSSDSAQNLSLDSDTDGLLSNVTDAVSFNDQTSE